DGACGARGPARPPAEPGGVPSTDDRARLHLPRHQSGRVPRQVRPSPRAGRKLPFRRTLRPRSADLLQSVFLNDRNARRSHDHRHPHAEHSRGARLAGTLLVTVLHTGRARGSLLALRRHRMDLPLSVALLDPGGLMSEHVVPFKIYAVIFATLLLLTLVTVDVAT